MSSKSRPLNLNLISRTIDAIAIAACFGAAGALASILQRHGFFAWPEPQANDIAGWSSHYAILLVTSLSEWVVASSYAGVYQWTGPDVIQASLRQVLRADALWLGVTTASIFLLKLHGLSRQFTATFFFLASLAIVLRFLCQDRVLRWARRRQSRRNALVIGEPASIRGLTQMLDRLCAYDSIALGHESLQATGDGQPAIRMANLSEPAANQATDVFLMPGSGTTITQDTILNLLKQGRIVHIVPAMIDTAPFRYSTTEVGGVPIITLAAGGLSPWQAAFKRSLDLIFASCLLIIASPLMVLLALAVKLTSEGPIFFRQERLGKDGRRFLILKYRTMCADAEALLKADPQLYARYRNSNFKLAKSEDFRVTPLGRFLRSSSFDELPQLMNVLRGDMSLVGPRPIVPEEIERYDDYAKLLLSVKPGITGYWQVNGRSLISDYAARVRLDMEYIRDQSLRADLQIMLRTVSAVTRMEGAH